MRTKSCSGTVENVLRDGEIQKVLINFFVRSVEGDFFVLRFHFNLIIFPSPSVILFMSRLANVSFSLTLT